MKKLSILFLGFLACLMAVLVGCEPNESPQKIYAIGRKYNFKYSEVLVELDKEEERFIFDYTDKDPATELYFEVVFTYNTVTKLRNAAEFGYTDGDGNEISFDENGYYVFNGSKTLYISYENAIEEIKTAILEGAFSISFGFGAFKVLNENG